MIKKVIFLIGFTAASVFSAPAWSSDAVDNKEVEELLIGLIPEQNIFKQMYRYKPLAEYLSGKLGIRIKLTILSKYGDVIDRFNSRRMDGAFFGDLTAVIAYERLGVVPVAMVINADGSDYIRGHIIVRNDGVINSVKDMRGSVIAFVDRASVSGYLFPAAFFKKGGVHDVEKYFSEVFYTGSHDASVYAVLDGRADIGCVKDTVLRHMIRSDFTIEKELKILATSSGMPNITLSLRKDIPAELRNKLRETLLRITDDDKGREVLSMFGATGFKEAHIKNFVPVYKLLEEIGVRIGDYNYRMR